MTISVNYNPSVLKVQRNLSNASMALNTALERMSTGFKLNSAADDSAGMYISTGMTSQIRGLTQARKNAQDGVSYLNTASGALNNMTDIINRLRDLAVQGANGVYDDAARAAMQKEADELTAQLNQIRDGANFNGMSIFGDSSGGAVVPPGAIVRLTEAQALREGYTVIKTATDLDNIRNNMSGKYILMGDIDLSAYSNWDPIGDATDSFKGVMNGNGYAVTNLKIDRSAEENVGLFGYIENAEIKNLGVTNANVKGLSLVGALTGLSSNSTISNSYSTGNVISDYDAIGMSSSIGGLVGFFGNGVISTSYSSAFVEGNLGVGGLVGMNYGLIQNSYATGSSHGAYRNGGLVGSNEGQITDCYSTGLIIPGVNQQGGLIGNGDRGTTSKSFWDINASGQMFSGGGYGCYGMGQLKQEAYWAGWDETIWDFSGYFFEHNWQSQPPVVLPDKQDVRLQIGANADTNSAITFDSTLSFGSFAVNFSSAEMSTESIKAVDDLIEKINTKNSEFGAILNRLDSILQSQMTQIENLTAARSTIMDADIAEESAIYVKNQILQQTSATLLVQSQKVHQSVIMGLVQG